MNKFISPWDFPLALESFFPQDDSAFILRQGIFSSALTRSAAIILSQGGDCKERSLIKSLHSLTEEGFLSPKGTKYPKYSEKLEGFEELESFEELEDFGDSENFENFGKSLSPEALKKALSPWPKFMRHSQRLYNFISLLRQYQDPWEELDYISTEDLILLLLKIRGIGPASMESLLLHVFNRKIFPAQGGLYRIAFRHGLIPEESSRQELSSLFMDIFNSAPDEVKYKAERLAEEKKLDIKSQKKEGKRNYEPLEAISLAFFHNNLQKIAKEFCKTKSSSCTLCPLGDMLSHASL